MKVSLGLMFGISVLILSACTPGELVTGSALAQDVTVTEGAVAMATATSVVTPTLEPTLTPTSMPTATPTAEPTSMPTPTPTPTPTVTAMVSPLATPTAIPDPVISYPPAPEEVNVPILMYHYISELPADADRYRRDLTVLPANFEEQLRYLQVQGYQSVTLADVYGNLTSGKPLPARPIVLTFDDGYKDAYTEALPLLQKYGFVGEFFLLATPAHYEAEMYMTWDDVLAMAQAGMSMQAHGRDHYDLTGRDYDFLVYQILGAKEAVEAHSQQPVSFFCYPSGRYDDQAIAVIESAGYFGAVTTEWGTTLRLDNRFTWPRIRVKGAWSTAEFSSILEQLAQ